MRRSSPNSPAADSSRPVPTDVVNYHNPDCGTSRNTLAMIRNAGMERHMIARRRCGPVPPLHATGSDANPRARCRSAPTVLYGGGCGDGPRGGGGVELPARAEHGGGATGGDWSARG